jgi:glycosyltransferase involved in cell wall biosynthesis
VTTDPSRVLLAIYADPERYPPTLSTATYLAEQGVEVTLLGRHFHPSRFAYPEGVNVVRSHPLLPMEALHQVSRLRKVGFFLTFCRKLWQRVRRERPQLIIAHDLLAAYAWYGVRRFIPARLRPRFWYHSHDFIHGHTLSRASVFSLAKRAEPDILGVADIFSIPVTERKSFYPLGNFRGDFYTIPNYPLQRFGEQREANSPSTDRIRLLYQGSLGDNHGFREWIGVAGKKVDGLPLDLTLIGPIRPDYKKELEDLATELGVTDYVHLLPPVPYESLAAVTSACHIGLATHLPGERAIYTYGATSSNKIYEYAALGKPVVLYDTPHYRQYLDEYAWTAFTDLTEVSLLKAVGDLWEGYRAHSAQASTDFQQQLHFEAVFAPVWEKIRRSLQ